MSTSDVKPKRPRTTLNEIKIRRARITDYINTHELVDLNQPSLIANALDINIFHVKNDLIVIKRGKNSAPKLYKINELIEKDLEKIAELNNALDLINELIVDTEKDSDAIKAIQVKVDLLVDLRNLEHSIRRMVEDEEIKNPVEKSTEPITEEIPAQ